MSEQTTEAVALKLFELVLERSDYFEEKEQTKDAMLDLYDECLATVIQRRRATETTYNINTY